MNFLVKIVAGIVVWLGLGLLGSGLMLASLRGDFPRLYQSPAWAAKRHGIAIIFSVTGPVGLLVAVPMSGFGYHGWTLTREPLPCTSRDPEIWCEP